MPLPTIEWEGNVEGRVRLIDQTMLPAELKYIYCEDLKSIWHAIKTLTVRGAPAIGIAAVTGVLLGIKAICRQIGENGAKFIKDGDGVLTHCNAGGLATADYGTALAVMFKANENGKKFKVYADETRPLF